MSLARLQINSRPGNQRKPPRAAGRLTARIVKDNCARLGVPVDWFWTANTRRAELGPADLAWSGAVRFGLGAEFDGTTTYADVLPDGTSFFANQSFSILVVARVDSVAGDRCLWSFDQGAGAPYYSNHLRLDAGRPYLGWNNAGAFSADTTILASTSVGTGLKVIVGCWKNGDQRLYCNGVLQGSKTQNHSITYYNTPVRLGRYDGTYATMWFSGAILLAAYSKTCWADGAARQVSAAWSQLLAPPPRTLIFDLAAGGGTTYNESVSLGASAAIAQGNVLTLGMALELLASAAMGQAAALDALGAVSMGARADLVQSALQTLNEAVALSATGALSTANVADLIGALNLQVTVGLDLSSQSDMNALLSLPVSASVLSTPSGQAALAQLLWWFVNNSRQH